MNIEYEGRNNKSFISRGRSVRRSMSYPCDPAVRQRLRAQMVARQVSEWRRMARQMEAIKPKQGEGPLKPGIRKSHSYGDFSVEKVIYNPPTASEIPVLGNRKYLLRQKSVDTSVYEPLYDKLDQTPASGKSSETRCLQLTHRAHIGSHKSMQKPSAQRVGVKMLEQGPGKNMFGDLQSTEEDKLLSYLTQTINKPQQAQQNRSKFHDQNGHSFGSESTSEDEGLGSGESLASSPDKTNKNVRNLVRRKRTQITFEKSSQFR